MDTFCLQVRRLWRPEHEPIQFFFVTVKQGWMWWVLFRTFYSFKIKWHPKSKSSNLNYAGEHQFWTPGCGTTWGAAKYVSEYFSANAMPHVGRFCSQSPLSVTSRWWQDMSRRDLSNFIWSALHLHQLPVPVSQNESHGGACSPICPPDSAPGDNFGLHLQTFLPRHLHLQGSSLPPGT